MDVILVE